MPNEQTHLINSEATNPYVEQLRKKANKGKEKLLAEYDKLKKKLKDKKEEAEVLNRALLGTLFPSRKELTQFDLNNLFPLYQDYLLANHPYQQLEDERGKGKKKIKEKKKNKQLEKFNRQYQQTYQALTTAMKTVLSLQDNSLLWQKLLDGSPTSDPSTSNQTTKDINFLADHFNAMLTPHRNIASKLISACQERPKAEKKLSPKLSLAKFTVQLIGLMHTLMKKVQNNIITGASNSLDGVENAVAELVLFSQKLSLTHNSQASNELMDALLLYLLLLHNGAHELVLTTQDKTIQKKQTKRLQALPKYLGPALAAVDKLKQKIADLPSIEQMSGPNKSVSESSIANDLPESSSASQPKTKVVEVIKQEDSAIVDSESKPTQKNKQLAILISKHVPEEQEKKSKVTLSAAELAQTKATAKKVEESLLTEIPLNIDARQFEEAMYLKAQFDLRTIKPALKLGSQLDNDAKLIAASQKTPNQEFRANVITGNVKALKILLVAHPDYLFKMDVSRIENGYTALHFAVIAQDLELAKALVDGEIDVNQGDNNNDTALHHLLRQHTIDLSLLTLLLNNASCEKVNFDGETILHVAVKTNNLSVVKKVKQRFDHCNIDINQRDLESRLALDLVLQQKPLNYSILSFLLERGATYDMKKPENKAALILLGKKNIFTQRHAKAVLLMREAEAVSFSDDEVYKKKLKQAFKKSPYMIAEFTKSSITQTSISQLFPKSYINKYWDDNNNIYDNVSLLFKDYYQHSGFDFQFSYHRHWFRHHRDDASVLMGKIAVSESKGGLPILLKTLETEMNSRLQDKKFNLNGSYARRLSFAILQIKFASSLASGI